MIFIKILSAQLGNIASAIKRFSSAQQDFCDKLYEAVMQMEGFEESAFDYLNEDDKHARSFMVKNDKLRRKWLVSFFNQIS
jgi:hypothetical protein